METEVVKKDRWHVDRGVPLALIITMILQTAGLVWFAAKQDSRLGFVEQQVQGMAWQAERIIRIDERVNSMQAQMQTGFSEVKAMIQTPRNGN